MKILIDTREQRPYEVERKHKLITMIDKLNQTIEGNKKVKDG